MQVLRISRMAAGAVALTGCSLLYNPNNLPSPEVDAFVPVDPTALNLDGVGPVHLYEGQGTGGSRPAILAITGSNIADDAVVALVPAEGQTAAPMPTLELDHPNARRAANVVAVPVTVPIDPSRSEGDLQLNVQVSQMTAEGPITRTLEGVHVILHSLPELDAPITRSNDLAALYSRVRVPDGLTFMPGGKRALIRAVGAIELGDVHADAAGAEPGPGGFAGGPANKSGGGAGGGGPPPLGLLAGAGGGGFGEKGGDGANVGEGDTNGGKQNGDEFLISFATHVGSGGGGAGNPGGGAGGTIELTAGGTLTIGTITANGGAGGPGKILVFGGGGGGSGGVIVLRSGGPAKVTAIKSSGGPGGTQGPAGGAGGGGRLRYDVPSFVDASPAMPMASRRGVAFLPDIPLVTNDSRLEMPVISDVAPNANFRVYVFDAKDVNTDMTVLTFPTASVPVRPTLTVGYNRVCVTPPNGDPRIAESTNCIEIAYVP